MQASTLTVQVGSPQRTSPEGEGHHIWGHGKLVMVCLSILPTENHGVCEGISLTQIACVLNE